VNSHTVTQPQSFQELLLIAGENYFELDIDVGSSSVAHGVVRVALGYSKSIVVDMGFVLEVNIAQRIAHCVLTLHLHRVRRKKNFPRFSSGAYAVTTWICLLPRHCPPCRVPLTREEGRMQRPLRRLFNPRHAHQIASAMYSYQRSQVYACVLDKYIVQKAALSDSRISLRVYRF
jgi:hypothetical protein